MKPLTFTKSKKKKVKEGIYNEAKYPIIFPPFHGTHVPVQIKELTQAQILSCGNFSVIETLEDKIFRETTKPTARDVVRFADRNHKIVKESLVAPTYEQLFKMIGVDPNLQKKKKILDECRDMLKKTKNGKERKALEERINNLRIWVDYILPNDFVAFIVAYALGIDKSDIKLLTKKILLNAAILAERGHNNPADHIEGKFTAFMKDDINLRAWGFLQEKREEKKHGKRI